jgi:hypothetical protein
VLSDRITDSYELSIEYTGSLPGTNVPLPFHLSSISSLPHLFLQSPVFSSSSLFASIPCVHSPFRISTPVELSISEKASMVSIMVLPGSTIDSSKRPVLTVYVPRARTELDTFSITTGATIIISSACGGIDCSSCTNFLNYNSSSCAIPCTTTTYSTSISLAKVISDDSLIQDLSYDVDITQASSAYMQLSLDVSQDAISFLALTTKYTPSAASTGAGRCRQRTCRPDCPSDLPETAYRVSSLADCKYACEAEIGCTGIAYAASPLLNANGCKSRSLGHCNLYFGSFVGGVTYDHDDYICYFGTLIAPSTQSAHTP